MLFRLFLGLLLLVSTAACQSAPPTLVVLVVTATSNPDNGLGAANTATEAPTLPSQATPLAPSPTPDVFPTPSTFPIQVAEQLFEHGRMFWIQPRQQMWVLIVTAEGRGDWLVFEDTFVEGEAEFDPSLIPPSDELYQPERGFGKLWRENTEIQEALGWAITPEEFGYISRYEYHPGGRINANGQYERGDGYHILFSLYEEAFRFNEADDTWQLGRGE